MNPAEWSSVDVPITLSDECVAQRTGPVHFVLPARRCDRKDVRETGCGRFPRWNSCRLAVGITHAGDTALGDEMIRA